MKKKSESMQNSSLATLSRRQFLQTTAATCLAASMMTACSGGDSQDDSFIPDDNDLDFKEGTWHKSYCGSCIYTNCGTEIKVQNGVAIEIRGNKDHPSNKGSLCPRGVAMLANIYNPYRVKTPMKRTNPEKGFDVDPRWQEISWDEAMDILMQKLEAVRTPDDPRGEFHKLCRVFGFSRNGHDGTIASIFDTALFPNHLSLPSAGPLCDVHHAPMMFSTSMIDRVDVGYCDYLIKLGRNIGDNAMFSSGPSRGVAEACDRGMKVISVDPHCGMSESKSGEWVPIKPATDMAFLMGILHVMLIEEDVYDIDSLRWRTNAPYLVHCGGDLDGTYVREPGQESDIDTTKKPQIMGTDGNIYTYEAFMDEASSPVVGGVTVYPDFLYDGRDAEGNGMAAAFVLLRESVSEDKGKIYGDQPGTSGIQPGETFLDAVARLTGISVDKIRRIANEYIDASTVNRNTKRGETITLDGVEFPLRPAVIAVGRGAANQVHGQRVYIAANMINLVLGALGVPGTLVRPSASMFTFEDGMSRFMPLMMGTATTLATFANPAAFDFGGSQFYPTGSFSAIGLGYQTILDPAAFGFDYDIEVLFASGCNPFKANGSQVLAEAAWKKIPFIFNFCADFDESVMLSDLLLPEHTHYERVQTRHITDTMVVGKDSIQVRGTQYKEPPFPVLYNTMQYEDFVMEIAYRLGSLPALLTQYNGAPAAPAPYESAEPKISPNLDPNRKYNYKEVCDAMLKALTGDGRGTEWFKENGFFMYNTPLKLCYEYYTLQVDMKDVDFSQYAGTPYAGYFGTGRLPVYNYKDYMNGRYLRMALSTYTNPAGNAATIPGWEPDQMYRVHREFTPVPAWYDNYMVKPSIANGNANDAGVSVFGDNEYDMFAVNWKMTLRNLGLGGQDSNSWLNEVRSTYAFDDWRIQMHPEAAAAKGIQDGDDIRVTSQSSGASITGKVKLTNLIQKETLGFPGMSGHTSMGWNPAVRKGANYNALLSSKEPWTLPDGGVICVSVRVKIEKA